MLGASQKARGAIAVLALVAAIVGVLLALSTAFGLQALERLPEPLLPIAVVAGTLCEIWAAILIAGSILIRLGVCKPRARG